ncbi:putative rRNA methylase YtqB isoform X2 [Benincasa hispida]|uniref:putative rRNA methylase YtqB isoform X2 n=1 Tax=Benincasa hispida TaxID=102211 RepID=UPI001901CB87|nr:putative rRNA methylase YtqB isoform X2 [Benincasa hispida]
MLSLKFGSKWVAVAAFKPVVGCQRHVRNICYSANRIQSNGLSSEYQIDFNSPLSLKDFSSLEGLEDVMVGYFFGKKRATEVAHSVWKHVVRKGDTVVDATCGNGYDTRAMVKMVADESGSARVYAMDVQKEALENTSAFLDESLSEKEKLVKLSSICHSRMEDVIPEDSPVRLVAFNLGYLPGGNKAITTKSETTLRALKAAHRILKPGGLISLVVYVGHPGGLEELETIQKFSSDLAVENWICCKLQMLNRPLAPVPVFLFKR